MFCQTVLLAIRKELAIDLGRMNTHTALEIRFVCHLEIFVSRRAEITVLANRLLRI